MPQKEDLSFLFESKKGPFGKYSATDLFSTYKWVLIPGLLGLVFLLLALGIVLRLPSQNSDVVFSHSASSSSEIAIRVDVEGEVEKPGLYKLKNGDRIQEALIAAGGLGNSADRDWVAKKLNRAKLLSDGDKIYIPSKEETNQSKETATGKEQINAGEDVLGSQAELINVNDASSAQLDTLPGVGEVTAQKIISGRPYDKIEDLLSRKIVGKSVYEKIKNLITAP